MEETKNCRLDTRKTPVERSRYIQSRIGSALPALFPETCGSWGLNSLGGSSRFLCFLHFWGAKNKVSENTMISKNVDLHLTH